MCIRATLKPLAILTLLRGITIVKERWGVQKVYEMYIPNTSASIKYGRDDDHR